MEFPYKFPRHADVIAERSAAYRKLDPKHQAEHFMSLFHFADGICAIRNFDGERIVIDREEAEWRKAHLEVFALYA